MQQNQTIPREMSKIKGRSDQKRKILIDNNTCWSFALAEEKTHRG